MSYDFKKALIIAGLIAIGSDGAVSDNELQLLNKIVRANNISPEEEQKILAHITPKLGSAAGKGALLKESVQNLTGDEKIEIIRMSCSLMATDMLLRENELDILKKIGSIMSIPQSTMQNIIKTEMSGRSGL